MNLYWLTSEYFLNTDTTVLCYLTGITHLCQSIDGCLNQVVRIGRALGLGQAVSDTDTLQHSTHSTTCHYSSTSRCWHDENLCTTELGSLLMRNSALNNGYLNKVLLSSLNALGDSGSHFSGLSEAIADDTLTITDHDDCSECEGASTLCNFGNAVDSNEAVLQFNIAIDLYVLDCHND